MNKEKFDQRYKTNFVSKTTNWRNIKDIELSRHKIHYSAILLLMLALLLTTLSRKDELESFAWGATMIFLFLFIAHYYYTFLLILFIVYYSRKETSRYTFHLIFLVCIQIVCFSMEYQHAYNLLKYYVGSCLLLIFFISILALEFIHIISLKLDREYSTSEGNITGTSQRWLTTVKAVMSSPFKRLVSVIFFFMLMMSFVFVPILMRGPTVAEMIHKANLLYEGKQYEEALTHYGQILELYPEYIDAYFHKGNIYIILKKYKQAISIFNKALSINRNILSIHNNCGYSYQMIKDYQQALHHFHKTTEIDSNYGRGYFNIGVIYEILNKSALAKDYFKKAAELDPEFVRSRGHSTGS